MIHFDKDKFYKIHATLNSELRPYEIHSFRKKINS